MLSLYRIFLLRALEGLTVSDEDTTKLGQLRSLLGISEGQSASVYEAAAGPLFKKASARCPLTSSPQQHTLASAHPPCVLSSEAPSTSPRPPPTPTHPDPPPPSSTSGLSDSQELSTAMSGEMGATDKAALEQARDNLKLPDSVTSSICLAVYKGKLTAITEDDKIINEDGAAELLKLREFVSLTFDQVEPMHAEACSKSYATSVKEMMGTTGAIPEEYWEGLTKLRERLCLGEETAKKLFDGVATQKMVTISNKVRTGGGGGWAVPTPPHRPASHAQPQPHRPASHAQPHHPASHAQHHTRPTSRLIRAAELESADRKSHVHSIASRCFLPRDIAPL